MDARAFELPPLEAPPGLAPLPVSGQPMVMAQSPEQTVADLAAEIDAARAEAHAAGFQDGFQHAQQQLAPAIAALQEAASALALEREKVSGAAEAAAVELGLRIAEQALGAAIAAEPERVVDVVRGALRRLVERERVIVLVHPDDLDIIRESADGLVAELGGMGHFEVQAERRIMRGGAIVRTVEGEVDATLATKLERAREILEDELRA